MCGLSRTVDQIIAALAGVAHGVVSRVELTDAGITERQIDLRIARGALIRVFPGVYRVGHAAPSTEATYMAAVKACGDGAVLSGMAAAHLSRLLKGDPAPPEVTTRTERRIEGVRTRRVRNLDPRDVTVWRGIPVTTVPRTLVDLGGRLGADALGRVVHEAEVIHRTTPAQVDAVLARCRSARGARTLRGILHGETAITLSKLEKRFLALMRKHRLPLPVANRPAGGRYVDCRWPDQKLTVELDSYAFHNSRHAWELDRRREREAYARGDQLRRYTWRDVVEDPRALLGELFALLS